MFHVVYILNSGHEQFGDFWSCLGIFRKSTNLQKNRKGKIKEEQRLTWRPPGKPTCRPSPAAAPASCLPSPGRQAGARRRHQRAPRSCPSPCFLLSLSCWPGRTPRRTPNPVDTPIHPQLLSLALPHHGRRHRSRTVAVVALSVVLAPCRRVQELRRPPLLRASRAPSARLPRSLCTDLARLRHHRRSPLPSPPQQFVPGPAVCSYVIVVRSCTSPSCPFSLSSTVATARSITACAATELVAYVTPATHRPHHRVQHSHCIARSP